jgi:catechol 2,3-dioxygenase-like lactoylglutathione lyase family enzyme
MDAWLTAAGIRYITLFVEDLEAAKAFYQRVFDLAIDWSDQNSAVFSFGNTSVNLLAIAEADALIGPATVAPAGSGARAQFTIPVEDIDALCARLAERGVEFINGPVDRPWGVRTACFADPGGHIWELAEESPSWGVSVE